MSIIRLTEGDLHRIVRKVLSESMLLSEGYSGKYFESQIRDIVDSFMQFKEDTDKHGRQNVPQYFTIKISLKPFFDESDPEVEYHYFEDTEYRIRIAYVRQDRGHLVGGSYYPHSLYRKGGDNISLRVPFDATWKDVYVTLMHEVTHLVDDLIKNCKSHRATTYPYRQMEYAGVPVPIRKILYMLWGDSEFNAWQASHESVTGDVDLTEWAIDQLKNASEINDDDIWDRVKSYVAMNNPHLNLINKSPMEFKNYFIKTSFKLIKKMVKKYY